MKHRLFRTLLGCPPANVLSCRKDLIVHHKAVLFCHSVHLTGGARHAQIVLPRARIRIPFGRQRVFSHSWCAFIHTENDAFADGVYRMGTKKRY